MSEKLTWEEAHEALGLDPEVDNTEDAITKAYRRKALATHPDKNPVRVDSSLNGQCRYLLYSFPPTQTLSLPRATHRNTEKLKNWIWTAAAAGVIVSPGADKLSAARLLPSRELGGRAISVSMPNRPF